MLLSVCTAVSTSLTDDDSGCTVTLGVGEILEVVLSGNPTTGYAWDIVSMDRNILKQLGETKFKPHKQARGAGGKIIMHFVAQAAGKTCLKLVYHRSFEKGKPPEGVFKVTVKVIEKGGQNEKE